jgi:RNA polymerase-binding transcription factor DksA
MTNDRLTDPLDIASAREMELTSDALAAVRALVPEERPDLDEEVECECCGEVIDQRRVRLGFTVCTVCKSFQERQSKGYAKRSRHYDSYED